MRVGFIGLGHMGAPMSASLLAGARARYGDDGGEMLPLRLFEDLTGTPLRLRPPGS